MEKRHYGKWSPQVLQNAIEEYKEENIGMNQCCEKYDIPKKTYIRHMRSQVKRRILPRRPCSLNERLSALPFVGEEELLSHILKMIFGSFLMTL